MPFLLDTSMVSNVVRNPQGAVARRIESVGEEEVVTSIIVAAELRFGAARRGSERLAAQLESVLGVLEVLSLEAPADDVYGALRARIEREGRPMGANDLLIAAHAIAIGYVAGHERSGLRRRPESRGRELAGLTGFARQPPDG
jgi:tRNA(fMet)-specific endonuclease VapC